MRTDSKSAVQQPSSKIAVVSSSKNAKKKKSKSAHKSKHNKQRSDSSSSQSSNDYERSNNLSSSKRIHKGKNLKEKSKISSSNEIRTNSKRNSSNKKKTIRSKHDSSESPAKRNHRSSRSRTRSKSKSRSKSDSARSSDHSSSHESSLRYRKMSNRRSGLNAFNSYSSGSHQNFPSNSNRRYPQANNLHHRGGRMMNYIPPPMMTGGSMKNNNGTRRLDPSTGNSPPQSLLGGYRPTGNGNFRGRAGSMANQAYVHNMANVFNLLQQQQQQQQQQNQKQQKPGSQKFANPNNPNNRFYQQFQDNYKKISSGQKISNLYQASFPVQHIPSEMRFNFRLLGRNIFTASDEEEEEAKKRASSAEKRAKRRDSSSSSSSSSTRDRSNRRNVDDEDETEKKSKNKTKISPNSKTSVDHKHSTNKTTRNRTSSSTNLNHIKSIPKAEDILSDPNNLSSLLAGIIQADDPNLFASTLVSAAAAMSNKYERTKKQSEKKVQKFKNYARIQQIQATAAGVTPQTNPEEVEKKIHGLARRLQMKTIGLHDDYEEQGIKRSDDSSVDSDGERRHHSSSSSSDRSRDKDDGTDASTNSQRQRKTKTGKKSGKKTNAAGQLIGSSDSEQHRSDGNDSDGSMLNLNEDLKPISYYIKDRERMLKEMFRCVRGHKLQAILPDVLKTRSLDEIKGKCLDQLDILSKKRIRTILEARQMTSSSGTEDSSDEDDSDVFTLYPHLKSSLNNSNNGNNNSQSNVNENNGATTTTNVENSKKSLPNSKFRPVQMQAVHETTTSISNSLLAPVVVGGDEDVNDYYEGFKHIKKLSTLRRNEQEDDFLPFPEQSGKVFQPIGSSLPKFEFKPITSLTHSQQAHLNARRAANRQQEQQKDVRRELEDLLGIDDFVLPDGERPLNSGEISKNDQRRYGLPPKLNNRFVGPPKKGSLGDLLKRKNKPTGERSPSPIFEEMVKQRFRRKSRSLSSTGSRKWSRSSSCSTRNDRNSPNRSRETSPTMKNDFDDKSNDQNGDLDDMNDLSKLLDLNEEDELLLLQIEVEQEEKNIRRKEKRQKKQEKLIKKRSKKVKSQSFDHFNQEIRSTLDQILNRIVSIEQFTQSQTKRTFDQLECLDDSTKKFKLEENNN